MVKSIEGSHSLLRLPLDAFVNKIDEILLFAISLHHRSQLLTVDLTNPTLGIRGLKLAVVIIEEDFTSSGLHDH